ncbi:PEP-CTERM sorting domain-containing protein [Nitrosomonas sp.]
MERSIFTNLHTDRFSSSGSSSKLETYVMLLSGLGLLGSAARRRQQNV